MYWEHCCCLTLWNYGSCGKTCTCRHVVSTSQIHTNRSLKSGHPLHQMHPYNSEIDVFPEYIVWSTFSTFFHEAVRSNFINIVKYLIFMLILWFDMKLNGINDKFISLFYLWYLVIILGNKLCCRNIKSK